MRESFPERKERKMFYVFNVSIRSEEGTEYAVVISPLPPEDARWTESAVMFTTEQELIDREAHKMEIEAMPIAGGQVYCPATTTRN
jgi:hypothetical protein